MSDDLEEAFLGKVAEAPKNNEDETQKGVQNVYGPPAGREPGTLDAKWGDKPKDGPDGYPVNHSTGVRREARDGREGLLERLFDSLKATAPAEQAQMKAHYDHAGEGHPHSPVLQRGHSEKVARAEETLTDTVRRVVGRR